MLLQKTTTFDDQKRLKRSRLRYTKLRVEVKKEWLRRRMNGKRKKMRKRKKNGSFGR